MNVARPTWPVIVRNERAIRNPVEKQGFDAVPARDAYGEPE